MKPTILLSFANDVTIQLPHLQEERTGLVEIFKDFSEEGLIQVEEISNTTVQDFHKAIIQYENNLVIFHYAGHADGESLHFEDTRGYIHGLSKLLGGIVGLKLVFLNGCATEDQVEYLLNEGVKAVIATRASIDDNAACKFSIAFYQYFAQGKSISECYGHACDFLSVLYKDRLEHQIIKRSILWTRGMNLHGEKSKWGLFYRDDTALSYRGFGTEIDKIYVDKKMIDKLNATDQKIPLNILLAGSVPTRLPNGRISPTNINNEIAQIKEYCHKLFLYSNIREKFSANVYHLISRQRALHFINSDEQNFIPEEVVLPELAKINLVVMIIWDNLGDNQSENIYPLSWLYKECITLDSSDRPGIEIFRRAESLNFNINYLDDIKIKAQRNSLEDFFNQIHETAIKDYHPDLFEDFFEHGFRAWIKKYIARLPVNSSTDFHKKSEQQPIQNPYKGLAPYGLTDANLFFGRVNEVDSLRERLADSGSGGLLAVVGASGSGKSSIVRAGLFHRLQLDAIPGSSHWKVIECKIGGNPNFEFTNLIGTSIAGAVVSAGFLQLIEADTPDFSQFVYEKIKKDTEDEKIILFIDQFEEIFTLIKEQTKRARFIDFIVHFAGGEQQQVILTLRSDFFHRCLDYKELTELMKKGQHVLLPPGSESLIRIIGRPAEFSGLKFEEGLMGLLQKDIGSIENVLPLLSYTLEQLFNKAEGNLLTLKAYKELGGVVGVIQKQAEKAIKKFDVKGKEFKDSFNFLFRKLIMVGTDGAAGKRSAVYDPDKWPSEAIALVQELINQRLLVTDSEQIEIIHEALLRHWDILSDWILDVKSSLLLMTKVEQEAKEWKLKRSEIKNDRDLTAFDRESLWKQERLDTVHAAIKLLGFDEADELDKLYPNTKKFIRPEFEWLQEELEKDFTGHQRRAEIGDRFAILGDLRPGIGLTASNLPDIVWCSIPGGSVLIEGVDQLFQVKPFSIAKYPVTLRQFNLFTQNNNIYFNQKWWEGLPVNPREHKPYPQTPDNLDNRPAELVSWYQAVAFCRWLTVELGFTVRLPYEWEWQQAACGGRKEFQYPWGEHWEPELANNNLGVGYVIAAGLYPGGQSLQGVMDMGGNVYEWCQNAFENVHDPTIDPAVPRVTKGGSWARFVDAEKSLKISFRLKDLPTGKNQRGDQTRVGFRLVKEPG